MPFRVCAPVSQTWHRLVRFKFHLIFTKRLTTVKAVHGASDVYFVRQKNEYVVKLPRQKSQRGAGRVFMLLGNVRMDGREKDVKRRKGRGRKKGNRKQYLVRGTTLYPGVFNAI